MTWMKTPKNEKEIPNKSGLQNFRPIKQNTK
jgi:hypothetical protein